MINSKSSMEKKQILNLIEELFFSFSSETFLKALSFYSGVFQKFQVTYTLLRHSPKDKHLFFELRKYN